MSQILLIEDNDVNCELAERYLELYDHHVRTAHDGAAGIAKAKAEHAEIDLILLDMDLPEVDGWEVARQLKSSDTTRAIPVIALTAHAMVGDREKALAAGCDEYESKPINFPSLIEKINVLIANAVNE